MPLAAPEATEPDAAGADPTSVVEESESQASAPEGEGPDDAAQAAEPAAAAAAATPSEDVAAGVLEFEITSQPAGAFVTVNGKRKGRTPIVVEHEVGTKLSIYTKLRGYLGQRRQFEVTAGQDTLTMQLVPLPYVVQVDTDPPGAMASAVGGGVVVTPSEMRFKSMPKSRRMVISMNGYETTTMFVKRASFTEETRRMFTTVTVTLQKEGSTSSAEAASPPPIEQNAEPTPTPSEETAEPAPAPAPSEVKAEAEPPADPEPVEEAAAPSETAPADAP